MKTFSLSLLLVLFIGCSTGLEPKFSLKERKAETCESCAIVHYRMPEAKGSSKLAKIINTSTTNSMISLLETQEENAPKSMEEAISKFKQEHQSVSQDFPEHPMQWEALMEGEVIHHSPTIITIQLNSYIFTGGAHGYSATNFLNFDVVRQQRLEADDLFNDKVGFEKLAEKLFRKKEGLSPEQGINDTGFWFEDNRFVLPKTIGYTATGIQLVYNRYEIASYADGAIVLDIPYRDALPYLQVKTPMPDTP